MRINFIKYLGIIYFLISILYSCNTRQELGENMALYIPDNAALIIHTTQAGEFISKLDSTALFKQNSYLTDPVLKRQLLTVSHYSGKEEVFMSFSFHEDKKPDFTFLTPELTQPLNIDSIPNKSVETFSYNNFHIRKYTLEDYVLFTSTHGGVFMASNSKEQLEYVLNTNNTIRNEIWNKAMAASDPEKTSIFLDHSKLDLLLKNQFPKKIPLENLATWSVLDIEIQGSQIILNGIAIPESASGDILTMLKDVEPRDNEIAKITPVNAAGFYSITYKSFKRLHHNLKEARKDSLVLSENHLLNFTEEAGLIFSENGAILVLKTTDAELARETFNVEEPITNYLGTPIYRYPVNLVLTPYLAPLLGAPQNGYYSFLNNFIVFSQTPEDLKGLIRANLNNNTLGMQDNYASSMTHLAAASSLLMVANSSRLQDVFNGSEQFSDKMRKLNLEGYPVIALQFVSEKDFAHIHGVFSTSDKKILTGTQLLTTIELEANRGTPPFLIKNHQTGRLDVIVQDENHTLYRYSSEGRQLWKKSLKSRITSEIFEIDLYKNGNLQIAFSTQDKLYILDRNGKNTAPYPLEFKDPITQPLAVFDYDNNRNYRFLITQGNDILMYDSKAKIVTGFDFKPTTSPISSLPKHIRTGNKDYIIVPENNGTLHILSRQGKSRISVKRKINFSNNAWYQNNGNFVSVSSEGDLVRIDEKGTLATAPITTDGTPLITATRDVLVMLSENILTINNSSITLDYGLYTAPEIFTINNNTYVSITDTQGHRVFIFDKQGKLIPRFPVYGTSLIDMQKVEEEIFVTVSGEEKSVLVYKF